MIEMNLPASNFIVTSAEGTNSAVELTPDLPINVDVGDDFKTQESDEENPFLSLMAQILADYDVPEEMNIAESKEVTFEELEQIDPEMPESPIIAVNPDLIETEVATLETDSETQMGQNVALTWIQAKGYVPPKGVGEDKQKVDQEASVAASEQLIPEEWLNELEVSQVVETSTSKDEPVEFKELLSVLLDPATATTTAELKDKPILSEATASITTPGLTIDSTQSPKINAPVMTPAQSNKSSDATPTLTIPVDVNYPKWGEQFSEHIVWMGQNQEVKSARIKLHPEDLGPIEISIKMLKDNASVSIQSHSAVVRELMDQALPKLRDMMSDQGINLADVHIGAEAQSQQFTQNESTNDAYHGTETVDEELHSTPLRNTSQGLVDFFA